ncbi:MAG: hypothetical protein LBJ18_03950 [Rickettsiales bacterium]|jgi:phage repressor protein C with HTH and peptisase S24 domain|nr:hypothetical protein [Rickettsiales bacterium]
MTHQEIWQAIERFAAINNMSCSGLAKCSGLDATTFNRSKRWSSVGQQRWPSTQSIAKILSYTGSDIDAFVKCMKPEGPAVAA